VHSLSKRSNLAVTGGLRHRDPALIAELLEIRKPPGMMPPALVQAMTAALNDDEHAAQRQRYAARHRLRPALEAAGSVTHSEAVPGPSTVHTTAGGRAALAEPDPGRPGEFYGSGGCPPRAGRAHRHR
jgi:hypothetical protein